MGTLKNVKTNTGLQKQNSLTSCLLPNYGNFCVIIQKDQNQIKHTVAERVFKHDSSLEALQNNQFQNNPSNSWDISCWWTDQQTRNSIKDFHKALKVKKRQWPDSFWSMNPAQTRSYEQRLYSEVFCFFSADLWPCLHYPAECLYVRQCLTVISWGEVLRGSIKRVLPLCHWEETMRRKGQKSPPKVAAVN